MLRIAVALVLCALGCGSSLSVPGDAAARDARGTDRVTVASDTLSPTADSDGDGLCDATEGARRSDPTRADTDFDGLIDGFELRFGSDPLNANSPSSRDRWILDERAGSEWPLPWSVNWDGMGEGLLVTLLDRGVGVDDRRVTEVSDFAVEAVNADPVAFITGAEGPRFFGVRGPVRLEWRLTARWRDVPVDGGAPAALGCRRAYESLAIVKQDGGETVAARRVVLDVNPPTMDGGASPWPAGVTAEGFCRYRECF